MGDLVEAIIGLIIGVVAVVCLLAFKLAVFLIHLFQDIIAAKRASRINDYKSQIDKFEREIERYEEQLGDKQAIVNLLELFNAYNCQITDIVNKPEFNNIEKLIYEIESRKEQVIRLSNELEKLESKQQDFNNSNADK